MNEPAVSCSSNQVPNFPVSDTYRIFPCTNDSTQLLVLFPNSPLRLFGSFQMQCLFGDVIIGGYRQKNAPFSIERWLSIVSPVKSGPPIVVKSAFIVNIPDKNINISRLKWRIKELTSLSETIIQMFPKDGALLLIHSYNPPICSLIKEMYGDFFLNPSSTDKLKIQINKNCCIMNGQLPDLYTGQLMNDIDQLYSALRKKRENNETCVLTFLGIKDTGKSTLARNLANFLLSDDISLPIYYMDTDLGQSEMTPSGCVSLFKLKSPLLKVPFAGQIKTFSDTYFCANITPDLADDRYFNSIKELMTSFHRNAIKGSILIVNTHGWLSGLGLPIMLKILRIIQSNFVFQLRNSVNIVDNNLDVSKTSCSTDGFWISPAPQIASSSGQSPTAANFRDMQICGYFSHLLHNERRTLECFSEIDPLQIKWSSLGLYFPSEISIPDEQILNVLNLSIVALCSIPSHLLSTHYCNDDTLPYKLKLGENQLLSCVGFGLVRAVNTDKKFFYILTPVDRNKLKSVNVLAMGNDIQLPSAFLFAQTNPGPYVVRHLASKSATLGFHKALHVKTGHFHSGFRKRHHT